ncbi:hypothetical protein [Paenirhodobacter sp. CAU 1674]|nr:hypothetical protein [Paenirhodobacter sp. CAU 1674]MDF2141725.1 hypothetical protein [Paenirhodobacter sp. CAU 1674]
MAMLIGINGGSSGDVAPPNTPLSACARSKSWAMTLPSTVVRFVP